MSTVVCSVIGSTVTGQPTYLSGIRIATGTATGTGAHPPNAAVTGTATATGPPDAAITGTATGSGGAVGSAGAAAAAALLRKRRIAASPLASSGRSTNRSASTTKGAPSASVGPRPSARCSAANFALSARRLAARAWQQWERRSAVSRSRLCGAARGRVAFEAQAFAHHWVGDDSVEN